MKQSIFILLFSLIVNITFSQIPMKKKLKNLMRRSIAIKENGAVKIASEKAWIFDNTDSAYFKRDTVIAYIINDNKVKYFCTTLYWNFTSKHSIIISQAKLCTEPPRGVATKYPKGFLKTEINNIAGKTILKLLNTNKIIEESFKLIEIKKAESIIKLCFKREK